MKKPANLPEETPIYKADGIKLFTGEENVDELNATAEKSLKKYLQSHFSRIVENDYFALLAYIEMNYEKERIYKRFGKKF